MLSRVEVEMTWGHRRIIELPEVPSSLTAQVTINEGDNSTPGQDDLVSYIRQSIIGSANFDDHSLTSQFCQPFLTPFGHRYPVYFDWTASGKPVSFIEDFIRDVVLPVYSNTHTTGNVPALQTSMFREESRGILIRNSTNASSDLDDVIFCGAGATSAVCKLVSTLKLVPDQTVIFASIREHHSNLLPWRETGCPVILVPDQDDGLSPDLHFLESQLKERSISLANSNLPFVGSFSACSNLNGLLNDVDCLAELLHKYGGIACFDYAAAAPYTAVNMNPQQRPGCPHSRSKDAIFFSGHKFIGGPQSSGILIAKKRLFRNPVPECAGGGSVFFVHSTGHRYLKQAIHREEAGTPAIVADIRAGLALQLKDAVGIKRIASLEKNLLIKAHGALGGCEGFLLLGPPLVGNKEDRLPIISFLIHHRETNTFLHHNFVVAILNDLFGIVVRGGCQCAGPYAQQLLGIPPSLAEEYEHVLLEHSSLSNEKRDQLRRAREFSEHEILRPGLVRLSLHYTVSNEQLNYVFSALKLIAKYGWMLLPFYTANLETAEWKHKEYRSFDDRQWLSAISYSAGRFVFPAVKPINTLFEPEKYLEFAENLFLSEIPSKCERLTLTQTPQWMSSQQSIARLKWFLMPSEALSCLKGQYSAQDNHVPPFIPRNYGQSPWYFDGCQVVAKATKSADTTNDDVVISAKAKFFSPPKTLFRPFFKALKDYDMIQNGDRVLVALSGGKDSLSLLHCLKQFQYVAKSKRNDLGKVVNFEIGAVTINPMTPAYDPSPLEGYLAGLGIPFFHEKQHILDQALNLPYNVDSICSFCSRMKRGRIYSCARREKYNVIAFGHHLDDLAESLLMNIFHNGKLGAMKANYRNKERDLRIIRPFLHVRESQLWSFSKQVKLPIIPENCPACFESPKERNRIKQLLAAQEILFPDVYHSIDAAIQPLVALARDDRLLCGVRASNGVGGSGDGLGVVDDCDDDDDDDLPCGYNGVSLCQINGNCS